MIKRIDRLIIKELFGPWLFGVGLFSALLMAATYLGRLVGFIVDQAPANLVGQLVLLLMPAILVKTFTMAVLLAALLAFGRLSSDSEIVALKAAGASIYRIVRPVAMFSLLIGIITFWFNEQIVPTAAAKSLAITKEIIALKGGGKANQPLARPYVDGGKLRFFINALNVNPASQALQGVTILSYDEKGKPSWTLMAKEMQFDPTQPQKWRIEGGGELVSPDYSQFINVDQAWPSQIPTLADSFAEITADRADEFDALSMAQLRKAIVFHRQKGDWTKSIVANAEYFYWNKLAVPFAAFVFGTLGAVLGIRNHRTGTAAGFALAVGIIFGYMMLANFMNIWAQGGFLPAYAASFAPISVGLIASLIIMWRRNA